MENLRCMIVDDEPLAVKMLENYIERTPYLVLSSSFNDPVQAVSVLRENPVNVLFLDIQMPDLDGLDLSRMVPGETKIIFTTAFREYAFESYEVNALDFLLKPIRYHKFLNAAEKAKQWFDLMAERGKEGTATGAVETAGQTSIYIRVDSRLRQVDLSQIVYVSGLKDYVCVYLEHEKRSLITHMTMKAMEEMLPASRFMRVHRSYIVALNKIRFIDRNNCIYIGDEVVHVTEAYRDKFSSYLDSKLSR